MAIFKIFKRRKHARTATELERRKIFWYLQRKSSFTLWQAYGAAFDRFAALVARQAAKAPLAVPPGFKLATGATWQDVAAHVATGQALFEQGLSRLARGDRSVWRHADGGVLHDASEVFWHWYTAIVSQGLQGDQPYPSDGRGDGGGDGHGETQHHIQAAMAAALIDASRMAHATAGIAEATSADTPAPERWYPNWVQEHALKAPFPDVPGAVPVPDADIAIPTGGTVPVDGIYEPKLYGGCMNYLLAGTQAPTSLLLDKSGNAAPHPVMWKLVWEDRRYLDGSIPPEEALYLGRGSAPAGARSVRIFNHFTGGDFVDIDDATGACTPVTTDEGDVASALSITQRQHYPIGGSYAIEDGRRYAMYWSDGEILVFRTPEGERFELFRHLDEGRFGALMPGLRATLEADGNSGYSTFRLLAGEQLLHELRYHSLRYQYAIGMNFMAGPDEDLSDWDFFLALKLGIEELTSAS